MESLRTTDMKRDDIINRIIKQNDYKSYLEIGIQGKANWNLIECDRMVGVEPVGEMYDDRIKKMTSDEFFAANKEYFDVIFIDGNHLEPAVTRDINNACKWLTACGTIVLHDAYPPEYGFTAEYLCGTVFLAIWQFRLKGQYKILTYAGDYGVCLLKRHDSFPATIHAKGDYNAYVENAHEIINIKHSDVEFLSELKVF